MATIIENIQTLQSIKSDIKNAIIERGGSVTDAFGGYAQANKDLPSGGGGGTEIEDALVMRTLSEYYNDRVSVIANYAFYSYSNLTSVNLPNCTSVNDYAFAYCYLLKDVDLPNCSYVGNGTFSGCSNLTQLYINSVTSVPNIYSGTFNGCSNLTSIYVPTSLVDSFKNASYWSSLSSKFVGV